jgi:carbon-monoxide dehydrogenase medium subunit
MDIALVGVGLRVLFEPNGEKCREVSLALGAVGPVPIRVRSAEREIVGSLLDDRVIEGVSQFAGGAACPISDIRASAGYRLSLVEALTHKALTAARLWIRGGGIH